MGKTKKELEDQIPKCKVCGKILLICKCKENQIEK
jgi:hypothetical protein